jgi:DNA-binding response OmpR family regulator
VPKRILIVEDEADLRVPLARRLSRAGHRVAEAENGLQALSVIHREPPDLVVLDVSLPLLDGRATLRRLRADRRFASLPVLMLTGVCDSDSVHEILRLGVSQYLVKPCDGREVETTIHWILEREATRRRSSAAPARAEEPPSPDAGRTSVLVAESNDEAARRLAAEVDGPLFVARDGAEAVHAAWKMRPRVAIVSTQLPVVDGLEVIARLRAMAGPLSCAVVATALRTDLAAIRLARQAGAHAVLEKPFEPDALRRLLHRLRSPAERRDEERDATILLHPEIPRSPDAPDLVDRLRRLAERGVRRAIVEVDPFDPPDLAAAQEIAEAAAFARGATIDLAFVASGEIAALLRDFRETAEIPIRAAIDDVPEPTPADGTSPA